MFVVVESPVKPVLDLTNSSDDDIPAPKKRAIDSSSDSDQKESLLLLTIPVLVRCLIFLILIAPPLIPVILSKTILSFVLTYCIFCM